MPSDSKKKREQKKKEAAKKRDVKKPTAACDTASDSETAARLTDGDTLAAVNGDRTESQLAADEGATFHFTYPSFVCVICLLGNWNLLESCKIML